MPPLFEFQPYQNGSIGSIVQLMQQPARARAEALRVGGDAEGRRALVGGQAWANAAGSIGQLVAGIPQQMQATRDAGQARDLRAMQIKGAQQQVAEGERAQADRSAVDAAMQQGGGVRNRVLSSLAESGNGHLAATVSKMFDDADAAHAKTAESRRKADADELQFIGGLAAQVKAANYDPQFLAVALDYADEKGYDTKLFRQQLQQQPDGVRGIVDGVLARAGKLEKPATREIRTRNADGSEAIQIVPDTPGQSFASAAAPVKEQKYSVTVDGPDGRPMQKLVTEAELSKGIPAYREATSKDPARFWVMRDGKPLRVSEQEYQQGDQPASTREYGRPVTSGDAGDLADFDTSLDDLKTLRGVIAPINPRTGKPAEGVTGASASIGAAMPDVLTSTFGWGEDAKKKQALIDRVKQVIGKTLEGGVLRKEDEYKYEKILPTIRDSGAIVVSKLDGLEAAIQQRKGRRVDALADAGYDVSRFQSRTGPSGGGVVTVQAPDGKAYSFPNQAAADAFKRSAGIH